MAKMEIKADFDSSSTFRKKYSIMKIITNCYLEIQWNLQDYAQSISIYPKYVP